MTQDEIKDLILRTFGSKVLPGGFSADVVAQFYHRYMSERGFDPSTYPTTENLNAFISRCQGW